jgi:MinD superfamily P-loop ATPase
MRRYIQIEKDLCTKCNECVDVCDWFDWASGHYGEHIMRPAFLHCIYCKGACTVICDQNAIKLIDTSGPHVILCRDRLTNNFIE